MRPARIYQRVNKLGMDQEKRIAREAQALNEPSRASLHSR